MEMPIFENGMLMVMRLQVSSATYREDAMASGTTGQPDSRASMTTPGLTLRGSPGGTSAVNETLEPAASARAASRSACRPPRSRARPPEPAPRMSVMPKRSSTPATISASPWRATIEL